MNLTYRAIAVGLMAAGLTFGSGLTGLTASAMAQSTSPAAQKASATHVYLIEFAEPGLLYFQGDTSLRGTSPEAAGSRKLDATSPAAVAYSSHLESVLAQHLGGIQAALGRSVAPKFHYTVTHHGIALELTAEEASAIARLPQIQKIAQEEIWEIDTHRSAYFVGADTIWDGTSVPDSTGTMGQGVVIGIMDTGANQNHPSFAPMGAECGYTTPEPKLVAKDCSASQCIGGDPEDYVGHGSHVASTAGGNFVDLDATPAPIRPIHGIAPCAKLITYAVCPGGSCPGANVTNAIQQSIVDGIDVANFSLGPNVNGQPNPWTTSTVRGTLDMMAADIAVAMAAGNTRNPPQQPTQPVGEVKNIGPWVLTVANSAHDGIAAGPGQASVTAPTPVPAALQTFTIQGVDTPPPAPFSAPVLDFPANQLLCSSDPQPPAGYYTGKIAAIARGTCNFSEKVANAVAAGATNVLLYNNTAGDLTNIGTGAPNGVSVVTATQAIGNELVSFIASSSADVILDIHTPPRDAGGVLSGGSLRGPNNFADFTKPDITAPGTSIYAAYKAMVVQPDTVVDYGNSSGTSMSSPQVAGGLALIRAVHPTWKPMEVLSSLMLTAKRDGQTMPDTVTPADPDGVGSGMMDLSKAAMAGFVLDESVANFIAANPGSGGDPKTMNLSAVRNTSCNASGCSWTRTVKSTLSASADWTVSIVQPDGFTVSATPSSFTLAAGGTQTVTITATPNATEPGTAIRFGYVDFASSSSPTLHFSVAVQGVGGVAGGDADLMLGLNALPSSVANGGTVNYLANVANQGPDEATGVAFELDLPAGSEYVNFSLVGANGLQIAQDAMSQGKDTAGNRGTGSWNCGATGPQVTCLYTGTIAAASMAAPLLIETTISTAAPGIFQATGTVSADQTDPTPSNNSVTVDIEVTGLGDLIFADGFEDPTPAGPVCVDLTGVQGTGPVGDPDNTVIELNIGVGNEVTGVAADVTIEAHDPSWLSEIQVLYGSTSTGQVQLTPSTTSAVGIEDYSTGGVINLADIPLPNIFVDADGILKLEFRESFRDDVIPNSTWSNLEPAAVCSGLYLECVDQAACDAAVNAYNAR